MEDINRMKIEFDAKSCNEGFARMAVAAFVTYLDPILEDMEDIKTSVSEAVTNCIIHGYENSEGIIHLECVIRNNEIEITVIDRGKGIENIELARQPLYTSKPELERSGLGFTVMESFMDEVIVSSAEGEGTTVVMKKKVLK